MAVTSLPIVYDCDVVLAQARARELSSALGFDLTRQSMIATAVSEVARNILAHAGRGQLDLRPVDREGRVGLMVIASDRGRGIADVEQALRDGATTRNSLGVGLPGARRMMDDFEIDVSSGTRIAMTKWRS